ncbi:TIGR00730 family Rossman fold protein [Candidatus Kaiserbacteria bacterium]|nr:MAG: TIGR00730 family Rossman fold protein [Candidatus Kaiserbacteria bacterium]
MINENNNTTETFGAGFEIKKKTPMKNLCYDHINLPSRVDTQIEKELHDRAARIEDELLEGFHAIRNFPKSVTFFGSARFEPNHPYYKIAKSLSARICKEGYAVITGGGPGIMAAGNEGSNQTCNQAVGFNIELPNEQTINEHVTHGVNFHYFFTRKVSLFFSAETYLYFPGGFGTLDEFFELVTLIQTRKVPAVPVILVGSDFWNPIMDVVETVLLDKFKTISPEDMDLFKITDNEEEILDIIKKAPLRNEYN